MACVDQAIEAAWEAGAQESNAMVHFRRVKDHLHLIPRMDADTQEGDGRAKSGLLALLHYLSNLERVGHNSDGPSGRLTSTVTLS
ncbi:hypothetical protein MAE02_05010 [Microvirga aerophila]|uniref:Uncharacterized protein n=1 Tax=Microvirga aerophila TaxID=670291 RepID=A0A512BLM3_9HYPH|nr:hypothetical protein MAE02_05010 [Microvirga aerophila]